MHRVVLRRDQAAEMGWTAGGGTQGGDTQHLPQSCSRMKAQPENSIPEPSGPRLTLLHSGQPSPHRHSSCHSTQPTPTEVTLGAGRHPVFQAVGEREASSFHLKAFYIQKKECIYL